MSLQSLTRICSSAAPEKNEFFGSDCVFNFVPTSLMYFMFNVLQRQKSINILSVQNGVLFLFCLLYFLDVFCTFIHIYKQTSFFVSFLSLFRKLAKKSGKFLFNLILTLLKP